MIYYGAVLRFNLIFDKWWYTNMSTNSYNEVSNTFTIIGFMAKSTLKLTKDTRIKIIVNAILEMKVVT